MQTISSKTQDVIFLLGGCLIHRKAKARLKAGLNEIVLEPVEPIEDLREINLSSGSIVTYRFENISKPKIDVIPEEVSGVIRRIKELKAEISLLEQEKSLLESRITGIKSVIEKIYKSSTRKMEKISENIEMVNRYIKERMQECMECRKRIIEIEENLEKLKAELDSLRKNLSKLSEALITVGRIVLIIDASKDEDVEIDVRFVSKISYWNPLYSLEISHINGETKYILKHRIKLEQKGFDVWKNIGVKFTTSAPKRVAYSEPNPWYIEPVRIPVRAARKKPLALPEAVAAAPPPAERPTRPFVVEGREFGTVVTYSYSKRITIFPDTPLILDFDCVEINPKVIYVWDAFLGTKVLEVIEFRNENYNLLPSKCNVYYDGRLVNSFDIDFIPIGSTQRWAVREEPGIHVKRKLVRREEKTKGILSEKAYIRLEYLLHAESHLAKTVNMEILDRIPVPRDPKIEVKIEDIKPSARIDKLGIVKWEMMIKPNEERDLHIQYSVYFPPDYRLRI